MPTAIAMHTGATATGNGNALDVAGAKRASIQVSGAFKGLVVFEGTVDGTNHENWSGDRPISVQFGMVIRCFRHEPSM